MSFKVQSDNLRHQAKIWAAAKTAADHVRGNLQPTFGQGGRFGVLAGSLGVSAMYDEWTSDMDNALQDASYSFGYLDVALNSVADDYDESDATSAMSMSELDRRLNEEHYHHD